MAYKKKTKACSCCKRSRRKSDLTPFVGGLLIGGAAAYALTRSRD